MPINTTTAAAAAAASSSSSARRKKGRRRNEYGDGEPEEEATLLGEGERDPGFLHDDEEEEGGGPSAVERAYETASQVRMRVANPPCPLPFIELGGLLPLAIDIAERVKGQISDCSLTTTRCVDGCIHVNYSSGGSLLRFWKDKLQSKFAANIVRNQKYNVFTFLPIVFYEQFKFFFNLYFLLVALSQFVPALRTGALSSVP